MKPLVMSLRAIACMVVALTLFATPSQAQVVINELHYHPEDPNGDAEFIELHNSGVAPVDISGWTLSGFAANTYTFPGSTSIAADGYVVVTRDAALLETLTTFETPYEWATGNLSNGGETVTLVDDLAVEIDSVTYTDEPFWPEAPDGDGPTLELLHPDFDNSSPFAWGASTVDNGTPGAQNSIFNSSPVVVSEEPARLSIVDTLPTVSVTFVEPVLNVSAGDLSVNGSAATSVSGGGAGPYVFSGYAAPTTAPITVDLAAGAITDLDSNAFAGTSWLYPNVVINEIHYHPGDNPLDPDGDSEFLELLNAGSIPADISGWLLSGVTYQFPGGTTMADGEHLVIAKDTALLQTVTGYLATHQWFVGSLSNGGERITLSVSAGVEADRVSYGDQNDPPWPASPDGDGPSLELIHPSLDNALPLAWKASAGPNGTPGASNSVFDEGPIVIAVSPERGALISPGLTEVSVTFHVEVTGVVAADLIVDGAAATGVTGSGAGPYVFTIPSPTSDQVDVTLRPGLEPGEIQDLDLDPFSGDSWQYVTTLPNVVINEIHYHPADSAVGVGEDPELLQFLELYNAGTVPVDLTGWRFIDGIAFDFPGGASMAVGEYIVIAEDGVFLDTTLGTIPGGTQIFTWDGGNLANGGESVRLSDAFGNTIDRVEYNDEGVWPATPDGTGPSLELINPLLLNQYAASWEASTGTNGTPGQENSQFDINPLPAVADVQHDPPIPAGGQSITITAIGYDGTGVPFFITMQLCYRQDQSPTAGYTCTSMLDNGASGDGAAGDGVFGVVLPGLADGNRLDFAIKASSGGGFSISPRGHDCGLETGDCAGANPSEIYLAKFSDAGIPTDYPSYHLITTQVTRDAQVDHTKTEYNGTVIHCQLDNSCVIHYNVIERYRGQSSLNQHPHSYNIRFPDTQIESEMGFDIKSLLMLGQQPYRQALGFDLFASAGHPTPRHQFVRFVRDPVPHEGLESYVHINIERVDDDFMTSQGGAVTPTRFPDTCSISDTACVTDLDCPAAETCEGNDAGGIYRGRRTDANFHWEGPGPPAPHPGAYMTDSLDLNGYQKVANEDDTVWQDLIDFADAFTCSSSDGGSICTEDTYDGVWESVLENHLDTEQAARWFAPHLLLYNSEGGLWNNSGDDYLVAFQDSGDHAELITWDMDALFSNNVNYSIWSTNVPKPQFFLRHNAYAGHFVGEICRLLDEEFSVASMTASINALPDVLFSQPEPQGPQGNGPRDKAGLINWVVQRHPGVLNQISTQTTLNGVPASPYTDANPVIALSGALNQCGARRVLINGVEADSYTIANPGGAGADWSSSFTLVPGTNNIVVQTVDHDGNVIDFASDTVIYSPPGVGGGPDSVRVTMPTRMVSGKTLTLRADILDGIGQIHWQTWTDVGLVSARRVSDQTPVATSVTVFERFPDGTGSGGPGEDEIRFYNGVGNVSITLDDPASVIGEAIEIRVDVLGLTGSKVVTVLDENDAGLFTTVSGALSGNVTWGPADGVIHLTGDVVVGTGNTLTIEPGTLIMVDPGPNNNGTAIFTCTTGTCSGSGGDIIANGTEAEPIMFFPSSGAAGLTLPQDRDNNYDSWQGIHHQGTGSSSYSYVFFVGAGNGDAAGHPRAGVLRFVPSSTHSAEFNDVVLADCAGKGLFIRGDNDVTLRRNSWSRIGYGGEFLGSNHDLLIEDSWFTRIGYGPENLDLDGDIFHLDNPTTTQTIRRSVLADCGDDMMDHSQANPVVEDTLIWDANDKCVSLSGGGSITFNNVLVFDMPLGVNGAGGILTHVTINVFSTPMGTPISVDNSIVWPQGMNTGSCNGNINYTLAGSTGHLGCGTGNLSTNPLFQDPGNYDYSLQASSPAATAGPTGGRIGWLGFPNGDVCVVDGDCDDANACTLDSCDAGACIFVPIPGCTPCVGDGECDDGNPCTVDTCSGGICTNPIGNDGGTCDDGLACTDNDVCGSGICAGTDNCPVGQVCGAGGVCILGQTTYIFQDDGVSYTGTEDSYIRQFAPDATHGTPASNSNCDGTNCDYFEWDLEDPVGFQNIGMLKFVDIVGIGLIPQGTLIDTATITIEQSDPAGAAATIHPLLTYWDEATVTWNNFGADAGVQPDEYGPQIALAPTLPGSYVIDITSTVQGWVNDPATNFGLLFIPTDLNGGKVRSSEYSVVLERPILTVDVAQTACTLDSQCDDGLFCNGVETCDLGSGLCVGGTSPCLDGVACTVDTCNETTDSCSYVPDDGACDDGNVCTDDTCDVVLGCQTDNNTSTCEDGDACTENDVCAGGICQAGSAVDCDDGASCTTDSCNSVLGCQYVDTCPVGEVCNVGLDICEVGVPADPLPIVIGDDFQYFKGTAEPSPGGGGEATTDWTEIGFDDSLWLTGATGFAYGTQPHEAADPDTNTVITDMSGNYVSLYFRRAFRVDSPATVSSMTLTVDYDDAFVAYVNGVEVLRTDLLVGLGDPPTFDQLANAGAGTNHEGDATEVFDLAAAIPHLVAGPNILSFQLHNVTLASSDSVLRPILTATFDATPCTLDAECDDGAYCNGAETCNTGTGLCEAGTAPVCDDGVPCTIDTCNETTDSCDIAANDSFCDDGNVCNGAETCDLVSDCQAGTALDCNDNVSCTDDSCDSGAGCLNVDNCPVGEVCNIGADTCEVFIAPQPGDVIISGFNASDNNNEWIELFNTTNQTVLLDDMTLVARVDTPAVPDGTLDDDWTLSAPLTGLSIAPHSFFLIGEGTNGGDIALATGGIDLSTGEMGTDERVLSMELTVGGVHMDYVLYGNHDGSDSTAIPPGDIAWDGVTYPRVEVLRPVGGNTAGFNEGTVLRLAAADLYAGYAVEGYYSDDVPTAGVWTSDHALTPWTPPRDSSDPPVDPPSPDCLVDLDCDNDDYCDGVETCNLTTNLCVPGTPVDCSDGIDCSVDTCNETTDSCESSLCPMDVVSIGGRYLSITPPTGLAAVALRVDSVGIACLPQYVDATGLLVPAQVFQTSAEWGTIFVGDREILPSTTYEVSAEVAGPQIVGQESATTWLWGDANNVDGAEVLDMLCVSEGFSGTFTSCTLEGDDVRAGIPDRAIDMDDVMAVLDGVALVPYPDADPCSGAPPAPPMASADPVTSSLGNTSQDVDLLGLPGDGGVDNTNLITLEASAKTMEAGQELRVDVFVREVAHLRGYQVGLEVLGGAEGLLQAENVEFVSTRGDFVFADLDDFRVFDVDGIRLGAALIQGGVESYDPIYLGTFVFKATETAEGSYVIRFVERQTFLRDDFAYPIERKLGDELEIKVVAPNGGSENGGE